MNVGSHCNRDLDHRNKVVFRGGVVDKVKVFYPAQLKGWLWLKHKMSRSMFSYSDWCL